MIPKHLETMLRKSTIAALLAVAVPGVVLWMLLLDSGSVIPAIRSPAAQANRPSDPPDPEVAPPAGEVDGAPEGATDRTSGMPPKARISFDDPLEKRIEKAKEASGLGSLADDELRSLLNHVVIGEKSAVNRRRDYLEAGGDHRSLEFADLDFRVENWTALAQAILEGSYVLVPVGEQSANKRLDDILHDPNVHVVIGPGGKMFQTYIIIDLQRHGRFAASMNHYVKMSREKDAAGAAGDRK